MTISVQEQLSKRVRGTIRTIAEARGLLPRFNHPEWPQQIELVLAAALGLVEVHGIEPDTAIANDYASLRAIICQIDWPEDEDDVDDEEADRRLSDLRARIALLTLDCDYIVRKAASIGITPDRVDLPLPDTALVSKAGREHLLAGLINRLQVVEQQLADLLDPASSAEAPRYQRLVRFYHGTMLANANSIRAAIGVGSTIDLTVLERAGIAMTTVTRQFIGTLTARASAASAQLKSAARQIGMPVQRIARGISTIVRHVMRSEARENAADVLPEDYVEQAKAMILAGRAPPVAWVPHLTRLDFEDTVLADLSPLSGLSALVWLNFRDTPVCDLSPLSELGALATLVCSSTPVSNLSPLSGLIALTTLDCGSTQVSDLSPLSELSALATLNCRLTPVSDLSPLSGLIALTTLDCGSTQVSDLSPLSELGALATLVCSSTPVSNLSPLSGLIALTTLDCGSTQVSDLSPLSELSALATLNCRLTPVSDLSPLSKLSALSTLRCWRTQVNDLSPLSGLRALKTLDCDDTDVGDLSPLTLLAMLRRLHIVRTPVADLSPIGGHVKLTVDVASEKQAALLRDTLPPGSTVIVQKASWLPDGTDNAIEPPDAA